MQVSRRQINPVLEKQLNNMWYQLITDTKNVEDAERIFGDLLSETEQEAIIKRLGVAYWLTKKRSYENIKENLKVSSATIAVIAQELKKSGWKLAMEKVMSEEWATRWESRIKSLFVIRSHS